MIFPFFQIFFKILLSIQFDHDMHYYQLSVTADIAILLHRVSNLLLMILEVFLL